jgi:hypothetical protein
MRMLQTITLLLLAIVAVAAASWLLLGGAGAKDWRTASREPVGLAPLPATTPEAVLQVYAARAWGWRGYFGVHTWIAVKPARARSYTVYEVIGWRLGRSDSAVAIQERAPDARWFGSNPELLTERRGADVESLLSRIEQAAREYPYPSRYAVWPGPNSNTFTAYVARAVPELGIHLPSTAIGKDYLGDSYLAKAPSGRGFQLSFYGLAGVLASAVEGIEVNLLGLSFGIDPLAPAVKLPFIGRIGLRARTGAAPRPRRT